MERMTFEGNFCDIAKCRELPCPYNGACSQRKVWERLTAYEETGLTPERCADFKFKAKWATNPYNATVESWNRRADNG